MSASDHATLSPEAKFHAAPDCSHKPSYRKVCEPSWKNLVYPQLQFRKDIQQTVSVRRSYEAHHLLCVAQIGAAIIGEADERDLLSVVEQTDWCINNKDNMLGMPMWGHTIMWYCNGFSRLARSFAPPVGSVLSDRTEPPPFRNLPQHNYGHSGRDAATSYNKEVNELLQDVINAIEKSKSEHKQKAAELRTKLNTASGVMNDNLKIRGARSGGTHSCWLESKTEWYAPFSMADSPRPIPHPKDGGEEMIQKIQRTAQALWR